jgi:hypothetical protein
MVQGAIYNAFGNATDAIFNLTAPAARVVLYAQGGGFNPQLAPLFGSVFIGNAAATVGVLTDALTQFDILSGVTGPITETLFSQYGRLGLPNYSTANLPAPSVFRKGQVAYDLTVNRPKWCNATSWTDFSGNTYFWSLAKTWAQVWAEVQAGGGIGEIIVESDAVGTVRDITAGSYDFTNITFRGLPNSFSTTFGPLVNIVAGVQIDAGSYVALRGFAVVFLCNAILMTPSAKRVCVELHAGSRLFRVGDITMFDSTATDSYILLVNSSVAGNGTTLPLFNLNSATAFCFVSSLAPLTGITLPTRMFGGVAGSSVGFSSDNFGGRQIGTNVIVAPTVPATGQFVAHTWPTAGRPTLVVGFAKGTLGYNRDLFTYEMWDGDYWRPLLSTEERRVSDGVIVANTFVKQSSATADRIVQFLAADDPFLICGIALDGAAGAGTTIRMARKCGQKVSIKSDGVSAIALADIVDVSTTTDGRVTLTAGGAQVSTARTAVAATADVLVDITF